MSQTLALPRTVELPGGGRLPRVGSVDAVALEARAAELAKRSIKRESKLYALELAIRMMDLTTLEGADTPGKVRALCSKAMQPDPADPSIPSGCRGLRVSEPRRDRRRTLAESTVKVASVATAFPFGPGAARGQARRRARGRRAGADEIDMVIDRGAFLSGRLREGLRRDRARQGGMRRRASQGDPRDGRARDLRQRAPRVARRDRRRRGLHQDVDRQGLSRRRRCP